jgi:hypothetical protein
MRTDWSMVGIGDFDGDGKSDLLWRTTTGADQVWYGSGTRGTVRAMASLAAQDPSWSVAGIGDFNANGRSDILWRNTDGSDAVSFDGAAGPLTLLGSLDANWQVVGVGNFR